MASVREVWRGGGRPGPGAVRGDQEHQLDSLMAWVWTPALLLANCVTWGSEPAVPHLENGGIITALIVLLGGDI